MKLFVKSLCCFLFIASCSGILRTSRKVDPPQPLLPVPTRHQLEWQKLEYIAFAHFGINTFTNREWGTGKEDPKLFNPTQFDANQWARTLKAAGMKLLILTAKHHDGFCLWPSAYTEHSVKNSPWKNGQGDIVKEVAEACRQEGIKFGFYLSPWDRNNPSYGTDAYNTYFKNQLRELLTNYGDITEVWFDGANGEGPNGKKQVYDFEGYYAVIRSIQPEAVIAIMGPDIRWVGNEDGLARENERSVQIVPNKGKAEVRFLKNPTLTVGSLKYLQEGGADSQGQLVWYPAECDVSIRPGWFYHRDQDTKVKSLDHLLNIYYRSVGRNSVLLLNLPPDRRGLIHENDVRRLKELRHVLDQTFQNNLAKSAQAYASEIRGNDPSYDAKRVLDTDPGTYWTVNDGTEKASLVIDLKSEKSFDVIQLQEPVELGERIAGFIVDAWGDGQWFKIAQGKVIGYKRLIRLPVTTSQKVRITITKARACPALHTVALYKQP